MVTADGKENNVNGIVYLKGTSSDNDKVEKTVLKCYEADENGNYSEIWKKEIILETSQITRFDLEIDSKDFTDKRKLKLLLESTDRAGNTGSVEEELFVNQETDKPVLSSSNAKLDSSEHKENLFGMGSDKIYITAQDDDGIKSVKYKFDAENKKWYKCNTDTFSGGGVGISVNPDYDQCDETQPDYIKNRTHYKEVIHQERVDLLPATEIDFSSLGGIYSQSEPLSIQVGDTVKVLWDSQEYECVAQSVATLDPEGNIETPSDGIVFGNLYYAFEVDPDSQDIPFLVFANYTISEQGEIISGCCIMPTSELTNPITVNIFTSGDKTVYHKLDLNYLPLSSSNISEDNNTIVTSKPLLNYLRANRPDWDISDRDNPRYIKNRPFYRELWGTSSPSLISTTITLNENGIYTSKRQLYDFKYIYNNSEGDISLTVHWHDGTYNCILRELYAEWTNE